MLYGMMSYNSMTSDCNFFTSNILKNNKFLHLKKKESVKVTLTCKNTQFSAKLFRMLYVVVNYKSMTSHLYFHTSHIPKNTYHHLKNINFLTLKSKKNQLKFILNCKPYNHFFKIWIS